MSEKLRLNCQQIPTDYIEIDATDTYENLILIHENEEDKRVFLSKSQLLQLANFITGDIEESVNDILYDFYVESGNPTDVNNKGFNEKHYLIERISKRLEDYFKTIK